MINIRTGLLGETSVPCGENPQRDSIVLVGPGLRNTGGLVEIPNPHTGHGVSHDDVIKHGLGGLGLSAYAVDAVDPNHTMQGYVKPHPSHKPG
jgi:hypothetical protein